VPLNISTVTFTFISAFFLLLSHIHTLTAEEKSTVRKYAPSAPYWTSIPIEYIAKFELTYATTRTFDIPYAVPDSAVEVLMYAVVNVGSSGLRNKRSNIKMYTQDSYYHRYEQYIAVHAYPQSAWSTNSENLWFPMTSDRKIYVNVPRANEGNIDIEIYVIGYR
jgi:hypothetical protein